MQPIASSIHAELVRAHRIDKVDADWCAPIASMAAAAAIGAMGAPLRNMGVFKMLLKGF